MAEEKEFEESKSMEPKSMSPGADLDQKKLIFAIGGFLLVGLIAALAYTQWGSISSFFLEPGGGAGGGGGETVEDQEPVTAQEDVQQVMRDAAEAEDVGLCARIADSSQQRNCEDYVYMTIALKNKDASLCQKIRSEAKAENCNNNVYFSKAISAKDKDFCIRITSEESRANCEATVDKLTR